MGSPGAGMGSLIGRVLLTAKGFVESRKGAVSATNHEARFRSPLIKPDVPISSIRLSDRVLIQHTQSPWLAPSEPHRVPRRSVAREIGGYPRRVLTALAQKVAHPLLHVVVHNLICQCDGANAEEKGCLGSLHNFQQPEPGDDLG